MTNTNLELWEKVRNVPKEHLKGFKRGGGFVGTAIKPMWSIQRMTEIFGPCGTGWGVNEPSFRTESALNEILVFCTVSIWHGDKGKLVYGVGGDKILAQFKSGPNVDDEAFKKAFTDAVTNALKHLGVGADIHMGLWDGNKYAEGAGGQEQDHEPPPPQTTHNKNPIVRAEFERIQKGIHEIADMGTMADLRSWWIQEKNAASIKAMPAEWRAELEAIKDVTKAAIEAKVGKSA